MLTSKLSYRIGTIVILVMMTLGTVQPAYAAPTNDNFANATVIGNRPYNTNITFSDATQETEEPSSNCGYGWSMNSVWFAYTTSTPVLFGTYYNPDDVKGQLSFGLVERVPLVRLVIGL